MLAFNGAAFDFLSCTGFIAGLVDVSSVCAAMVYCMRCGYKKLVPWMEAHIKM